VKAHPKALLDERGGFATTGELLTVMTRQQLDVQVKKGCLVRVWYGVYAAAEPDLLGRLAALDIFMGRPGIACLSTAAALYGFDTEAGRTVHVLDPGVRMRPTRGLMVHQRTGGPMKRVAGRVATAPAWTAVEVARELVGLADGNAESAMESEARLVMIDHGLPLPKLQYEVRGRDGRAWRVDFAWPEERVAAEYDSVEWHAGRAEMLRDRVRFARLEECGWTVIPIIVDDVRRDPRGLTDRIAYHLSRSRLAG